MIQRLGLVMVLAGIALVGSVQAQELPYREGPVVDVTSIRVQDGRFLEYWHFLETRWKPEMEEAKRQGLILSYKVLSGSPRTPEEPNLYLFVTYANFAALDGVTEKMSAINRKLFGESPQKAEQGAMERAPVRTVLGDEMMQELEFRK